MKSVFAFIIALGFAFVSFAQDEGAEGMDQNLVCFQIDENTVNCYMVPEEGAEIEGQTETEFDRSKEQDYDAEIEAETETDAQTELDAEREIQSEKELESGVGAEVESQEEGDWVYCPRGAQIQGENLEGQNFGDTQIQEDQLNNPDHMQGNLGQQSQEGDWVYCPGATVGAPESEGQQFDDQQQLNQESETETGEFEGQEFDSEINREEDAQFDSENRDVNELGLEETDKQNEYYFGEESEPQDAEDGFEMDAGRDIDVESESEIQTREGFNIENESEVKDADKDQYYNCPNKVQGQELENNQNLDQHEGLDFEGEDDGVHYGQPTNPQTDEGGLY
ncbi:MAG: hypothetical protein ACK40G_10310 [Cytophagaceae bacterium]